MRKYKKEIYKAFNPIENKHYVGQSNYGLAIAKARHKRKSASNDYKSPFYDAIRKFGFDAFEWETVCVCESLEELDIREAGTIGSIGIENCYNCYTGGKTHYYNFSDESKKDISIRMSGANNHEYGKHRTSEQMKKCKDASYDVCVVSVVKIETGEVYVSMSECAKQNNLSVGTISMHCNGKLKTQKYCLLYKR